MEAYLQIQDLNMKVFLRLRALGARREKSICYEQKN